MDVYQLVNKLGGEIVGGKGRVMVDGERVLVAEIIKGEFQLNEAGVQLAEKHREPEKKTTAKKTTSKRTRARNVDGTLKADDPSTPDVNEAWTDGDS
jgi:hypothetical protein